MKNFDDYYRETEAELLKQAVAIDEVYARAFLNQYREEDRERIAEWAVRYFADMLFRKAAERQWIAATEEILEESPDLRGNELIDEVEKRVDTAMGSASRVDSTATGRIE